MAFGIEEVSQVIGILIGGGAVVGLLVKLGWFLNRFDELHRKFDEEMSPTLVNVERTLDRISRHIISQDSLNPDFFNTSSPIQLNAFSKELLEESGAKHFVDSSYEKLSEKVEDKKPKSLLDINQFAISVIFDLTDTEAFSKIKDFIYQNPNYKGKRVDLSLIITLTSLYLRDKYLENNPELIEKDEEPERS